MEEPPKSIRHACPTCGGPAKENEGHTQEICIKFQSETIKALRREVQKKDREKMELLMWAMEGLPVIMKYQADLE